MGETTDFVNLYIKDSDILEDKAKEVNDSLLENIRSNLYVGHGYDKGELYRDISTNYETYDDFAIVMGWFTVEHGQYWYRWKNWEEDKGFLDLGVEQTLALYM